MLQLYLWLSDGWMQTNLTSLKRLFDRKFLVNEFESAAGVHDIPVSGSHFRYTANFPNNRFAF